MSKRSAWMMGLLVVVFAHSGQALAARGPDAAPVALATRSYVDDTRKTWDGTAPRPLTTLLWYPADPPAKESQPARQEANPMFVPLPPLLSDVPVSRSHPKYPLILISHGTGGSASGMAWLGYKLAAHGYIVAALNHHGNTAAEPKLDPRGFLLYWERAKDVSAVLTQLLSDPAVGSRIDRERIGAAGFSLGGYTVIALAGSRSNRAEFDRFCNSTEKDFTCGPQPEFPEAPARFKELAAHDPVVQSSLAHAGDSYRDPRIRAVFAIAPVFGRGFTPADLRDIHIPVEIVVGQSDPVAPPATNAQRYAALIPGAKLVLLPAPVTHYTFIPVCTDQGRRMLTRICPDPPGLDRAAVQDRVAAMAVDFFFRALPSH